MLPASRFARGASLLSFLLVAMVTESKAEIPLIGRDRTEELAEISKLWKSSAQPSLSSIKDSKILIVPGFLSDQTLAMNDYWQNGESYGLGIYFNEQRRWFDQFGIPNGIVDLESEALSEFNMKYIYRALQDSDRPVVLLSQSKGGLDILYTLLQYPEIRSKVLGWISVNAPFSGSPLADAVSSYRSLRWILGEAMEALGGDTGTIDSLRTDERIRFNTETSAKIEEIVEQIPILSIASWKPNTRGWDTPYELPRNYMENRGYETDGVVPWRSEVLPHSNYALMQGIDHSTILRASSRIPCDRVLLIQSALSMLERIASEKKQNLAQLSDGQTFMR